MSLHVLLFQKRRCFALRSRRQWSSDALRDEDDQIIKPPTVAIETESGSVYSALGGPDSSLSPQTPHSGSQSNHIVLKFCFVLQSS